MKKKIIVRGMAVEKFIEIDDVVAISNCCFEETCLSEQITYVRIGRINFTIK